MTLNKQPKVQINLPDWADFLFQPMRYKAAHGGRGGAKTTSMATAAAVMGAQRPMVFMCCRQFQNSMEDSVKPAIEKAIKLAGLTEFYEIKQTEIVGKNGTRFRFKGLDRNIMSIKGWEDVDVCWVEEANTLKLESWELLKPTIRKPGSEIWVSWNRHDRGDVADQFFIENKPPANSHVVCVNWYDNPWFPDELNDERLHCLETEPQRYPHIWEGEPDDNSHEKNILPFAWLLKAVDAHKKLGIEISGIQHSALDPADTGADVSAWAYRHGPLLKDTAEWNLLVEDAADKAHKKNHEHSGITRMYYDATGIGTGVRVQLKGKNRLYKIKPFNFGGEVNAKDVYYSHKRKNKDMFAKQNIQAAWSLRLRLQNTMALLDGKDVNPDKCLFIDGSIKNINKLLKELSQPVYDYDDAGRMKVEKAPKVNGVKTKSPNSYDATVMAFAFDIRKGIKEK